jgi:amidase
MTNNKFAVEEATLDDVHAAFATGVLTATGLVSTYLARIQLAWAGMTSVVIAHPDCMRPAAERPRSGAAAELPPASRPAHR